MQDDFAFATESVVGPYGVTAEIPDMDHVVEWQEFRAIPFQGYYRLILPPMVKALQAGIKEYYGSSCAVMFSSARIGLKELLEFLWLREGIRMLKTDASEEGRALKAELSEMPFGDEGPAVCLVTAAERKPGNCACVTSILVLDQLPENPEEIVGFDFVVAGVGALGEPINAGVILTAREEQAKEIHERNRRRGACISARDAAWMLEKDVELSVNPEALNLVTRRLCALEDAVYGTLYPSGMSAVTVSMDVVRKMRKQSHFVVIGHPYSDTHLLFKHLEWAGDGMTAEMLHGNDLDGLQAALNRGAAAVLVETISNPLNEVPDIERIAEIAHAKSVPVIVDNTMATPYNCKPLNLGADIVIHSTAKFLNGRNHHGGGVVLTNDKAVYDYLRDYRERWQLDMSPLEAGALWESIQDFPERMAVFNRNGLAMANWLEAHPAIDKVYFALLADNPDAEIAARLLKGGGSVVSFTLKQKGFEAVQRFYDTDMPNIKKAPSLGSDITLLCPYTMLTYYQKDDEYLESYRLDRYLLRLSVGSEESFEPVLNTVARALEAVESS